MLFAYKITRNK